MFVKHNYFSQCSVFYIKFNVERKIIIFITFTLQCNCSELYPYLGIVDNPARIENTSSRLNFKITLNVKKIKTNLNLQKIESPTLFDSYQLLCSLTFCEQLE